MSVIAKLPTGVPGLDEITYGGIPLGRTTLIAGKSGTCKSTVALQIACNLARSGVKTVVVAVEEVPEDLLTTGDSLGMESSKLLREGSLSIVDLTRPQEGPTIVSGEYDISGLMHRIGHAVREMGAGAVVLDSATALFSPRPPDEYMRSLFYRLVHAFRELKVTAIVTAEAPGDYGQLTSLGVEDFVCDLVIVMRNLVDGERRRRSLEIHKYRRSGHFKGEYPCTITPKGLIVFPLDTESQRREVEVERYSSGFPALDEMNSGGWLRDSIILLRGPSGSGKTTLAGMYARAGALRGERVVYYGFEETKPILMRNFASLQLPMDDLEKAGNLRIFCRYPEATSPEDMLVDLRIGLDEFKPSLIVLDSISSIEHSTSVRGFRLFMVGLSSIIREHSRSALLTQTINSQSEAEHAAPYLSTIPDAIVLMDYSLDSIELERSMRVLKMRGSAHLSQKRRVLISPGGVRVEAYGPNAGRPAYK